MCGSKQNPAVDPWERKGRGETGAKSLSNEGDKSIDLRSACCITTAALRDLGSEGGCNGEGGLQPCSGHGFGDFLSVFQLVGPPL